MNAIFSDIVDDLERKLQRKLTEKELDFMKWLITRHLEDKKNEARDSDGTKTKH